MLYGNADLKNARVTYKFLVTKMFANYNKIIELYIDNMLVKSLRAEEHLDNLKYAFDVV